MQLLASLGLAVLVAAPVLRDGLIAEVQPTVRASEAWLTAPAPGVTETVAFVTIDNGTMYDVYIISAETDAAATIELRDTAQGASAPVAVKEASVPAYGRLEMSPDAVHLRLTSIGKPLRAGDEVTIVLYTDGGQRLSVAAAVK
ncbi:MAG TPA: copper chaperone PCu(A)C [Vicinamibacterales bacterium]|nr:copper chaperone PCu(A)C [Vicinamibacterales bacterium]